MQVETRNNINTNLTDFLGVSNSNKDISAEKQNSVPSYTENKYSFTLDDEPKDIMTKDGIVVYIPRNLDLDKMLADNPPAFKYHIDNFKHILGLITEIPSKNKDILNKGEYVPINGTILQKYIHDYRKHLDYLIDNDVIETDNHFIPGEKSKSYRFTYNYQQFLKPVSITKASLIKNLSTISPYQLRMRKKYNYLYQWFTPDLKIDFEAAHQYLCNRLKEDTILKASNPRLYDKLNPLLRFNASYIAIQKIIAHDYHFSIDTSVGRCHTSLTTIHSKLREFIKFGNLKLVSIDIKNSQPCFSGLLLNPYFFQKIEKGGEKSLFNIHSTFKNLNIKHKDKSINNILLSIMLVKEGESIANKGFKEYLNRVQDGSLYEFIQQEIHQKTGKNITDRKELKEVIFTVLFTDNRFIGQVKAKPKQLFRDIFPDVYNVFAAIKKHDSTLLPRLLQSIEADLMLNHVAKRISIERPDMPIFTIHDSITCPVGNEDYVKAVIEEEMLSKIRMKPTLKAEYWSPNENTSSIITNNLEIAA
jgi:hypothetical protein